MIAGKFAKLWPVVALVKASRSKSSRFMVSP
jgi:hypothetical protein